MAQPLRGCNRSPGFRLRALPRWMCSCPNDGGASYSTVLADDLSNGGMFAWDTTSVPDGGQYRIRIVPNDGAGMPGVPFGNNGDFAVDNSAPTLVLSKPQGGGVFGGPQATISWVTTDNNPGTVEVALSTDSGANYDNILAAAAPDSGLFRFRCYELARGYDLSGACDSHGPGWQPRDWGRVQWGCGTGQHAAHDQSDGTGGWESFCPLSLMSPMSWRMRIRTMWRFSCLRIQA